MGRAVKSRVGAQRRERLRNSRTGNLSTRPSGVRTGFKPVSPESPRLAGAKRESRATLNLSGGGARLTSHHPAMSSQTAQKSHSPGSAGNSHPARAGKGTPSVWDFWSLAWTPVRSPETEAPVGAKAAAISGNSPLGPKAATCVVSGALAESAWHKAGAPEGSGALTSCHPGDAAHVHVLQPVLSAHCGGHEPLSTHVKCGYCNGATDF